jgi:hypothetical protein
VEGFNIIINLFYNENQKKQNHDKKGFLSFFTSTIPSDQSNSNSNSQSQSHPQTQQIHHHWNTPPTASTSQLPMMFHPQYFKSRPSVSPISKLSKKSIHSLNLNDHSNSCSSSSETESDY